MFHSHGKIKEKMSASLPVCLLAKRGMSSNRRKKLLMKATKALVFCRTAACPSLNHRVPHTAPGCPTGLFPVPFFPEGITVIVPAPDITWHLIPELLQ